MNYLVDSNVLSEATRPVPNERVMYWLQDHEQNLVVDSIVLGELRLGILLLPSGKKRMALETWFTSVVERFYCLSWDSLISQRWAALVAGLQSKGQTLPALDSMIAATALVHDLTVVTHNVRDFKVAGVKVVDPFVE